MKHHRHLLLAIVTLLFSATAVIAQPAPTPCGNDSIVVHTGYIPATKGLLPHNALDSNWVLVSAPAESGNAVPSASRAVIDSAPLAQVRRIRPQATSAAIPSSNTPYIYQRYFCTSATTDSIRLTLIKLSGAIDSVFVDNTKIPMESISTGAAPPPFKFLSRFTGTVTLQKNVLNIHTLRVKFAPGISSEQATIAVGAVVANARPNSGTRPIINDTCCNTLCTIQGGVYKDKNCSGTIDSSLPLAGRTMRLMQNGVVTATAITTASGTYQFTRLFPGMYSVTVQPVSGWTTTAPATGSFNVALGPNTTAQGNFMLCNKQCDSLTAASLDSGCCLYHMQVIKLADSAISRIRYKIDGGTIKTLTTNPPYTTSTPTTIAGTSSGVLTFNPPVNKDIQLTLQALPAVANGTISPKLTVYHGTRDSCQLAASYTCDHAEASSCDKLTATMYRQQNIDYNYIEFVITNKKLPASPICWVDIVWSSPLPASYSGGGLQVLPNQRPLFTYPYTRIPIAPTSSFSPGANSIRFNLGVNNTLGWSGTVSFVVHHCDGSTCTLNYGPCVWMPRP